MATKITDPELYALFYALHRHQTEAQPIAGLELDDELDRALRVFVQRANGKPPAPPSPITADRALALVRKAATDAETKTRVCEDGPYVPRPKTDAELAAEKRAEAEHIENEVRRFWRWGIGGTLAFIAGQILLTYRVMSWNRPENADQQSISAVKAPMLDPLDMLYIVLMMITAWGAVTCWMIAKEHWFDANRVKRAVPVIGKAWADRSAKKNSAGTRSA